MVLKDIDSDDPRASMPEQEILDQKEDDELFIAACQGSLEPLPSIANRKDISSEERRQLPAVKEISKVRNFYENL